MDYKMGAVYIRVSTEKQEELSPDAQNRLAMEYAKKNRILVKPEYIFMDNGISGRKADKRPEFQRMISLAKSKPCPFQVILVWKFSRFARNQEEAIVYKSMLKKQCGVDVLSISEPLIDGPFGSLIERIIEWMDEYYSINLSAEVSRGMTEKALRGGYQSIPPIGYQYDGPGNPYKINPEEAEVVKFIFDQFVNHRMPINTLARYMNDHGIRTHSGSKWYYPTVRYVLTNKFYVNRLVFNDIDVEGRHDTFISQDLFDRAQNLLAVTQPVKKSRPAAECNHWLTGVAKCGVCHGSMSFNSYHDNRHRKPFFQCSRYVKAVCKKSQYKSAEFWEQMVFDYFDSVLSGDEFSFEQAPPSQIESNEEKILLSELDSLKSREDRCRYAFEAGVDSLEEYARNKKRLSEERTRIEESLLSLKESMKTVTKEDFLLRLRDVYDAIKNPDLPTVEKNILLKSICREIAYDKYTQELSVVFFYS